MKSPFYLAFFASVSALISADASSNATSLPQCGLLCLLTQSMESSCSPTNNTCLCLDQKLADSVSLCLSANCTIRDQLSTEKYSKDICGAPVNDQSRLIRASVLVGSALANLAFLMRTVAKFISGKRSLGMDDLFLGLAMSLNVPFTVLGVISSNVGLGKDIWEISFDNITYILYVYFWQAMTYITLLPLTKISILFLYLRIFPDPTFRKLAWALIILHFVYGITYVTSTIFECRPISGYWKRWDGTFQGTCTDDTIEIWSSGVVNIVLDLATLILPLPSLYKLHLPAKKKVQVLLMFSTGSFVTIVSFIRLHTLGKFGITNTNFTQGYAPVSYWSTIEVHVALICACMPTIRQLYQHIFAKQKSSLDALGTTAQSSVPYPLPSPSSFSSHFSGKKPIAPQTASSSSQNIQRFSNQEEASSVHELIAVGVAS